MAESDIIKYEIAQAKRSNYVEAILDSKSRKKVVVAGPGTGKTYLFKIVLKETRVSLTLTFINSLVEDLSLELYGLSVVRTLHSFARSILSKLPKKQINVFPKLSYVIKDDAVILLGEEIDFDKFFYNRDDENKFVEFYKKRRIYYDYYGYTDIIFAAVKYFEQNKNKIPTYDQILVDEFQDFNKLEVSLIDLLAEKSPILLAGDDDQALYEFKNASTIHIRERYNNQMPEYESFSLPYCSRCTSVVVGAANDIIDSAKNAGFLNGRIDKSYIYFNQQKKDKESEKYSKIGYTQLFDKQLAWFIEKEIAELANDIKNHFSVLVISPFKKQSQPLIEALKRKGFQNIESSINEVPELSLLDGIKLLVENKYNNLGWRIVSKFLLSEKEVMQILHKTESDPSVKIHELIDRKLKDEVLNIVRIIKSVIANKTVDNKEYIKSLEKINLDPYKILKEVLKDEINTSSKRMGNPALRKIKIKTSTIQSSKGLSADIVFITHFDDRYFIKNNDKTKITDQDICNFLVALSRTKKKLFLISTLKKKPIFHQWINHHRIELINSNNA
jgi:superfamily I DNA/RNA helicase